jgi:WD40 repeat protein
MEREPVSVTTLNPATHRDLETICHKCLQKDPAKRYASAQEFADDLGRWLSGEPIRARAVSSTERVWRWVKRHRTVSALVLATAAAVLIGSAVSIWFGLEATREAKRAEREAVRALLSQKESDLSKEKAFQALAETEEARKKETEALELAVRNERIAKDAEKIAQLNAIQAKEAAMLAEEAEKFAKESEAKSKESEANAIRSLARSDYMLALARWNENRVSEAKQFLNRIPKEYRFFEWRLAARVFEGEELTLATPAQSFFSCVAFSPDGSLIASGNFISGQFEIWDPSSGKKRGTLGGMFNANPTPRDLKFSPDGKLLATASGTSEVEIKLWNISTGREIWSSTSQENIGVRRSLSFSPDGNQIAFGAADGEIQILDVKTGAKINGLKGHKKEPEVVLFSPDGRTLASCDHHGEIKLWQRDTGNEIETGIGKPIDNESPILNRCLTFSPDSRSIIARSYRDTIKIWDIATGKEGRTFLRNDKAGGSPASVAISPDGACLAVGMSDGMIFVWDISTGDEIKRFSGNESSVNSLAFSPDARRIVSGSGESRKIGSVKVWNLISASESARVENIDLNQLTNLDTALAFSPDGQRILSTAPFAMNLWDAKTGQKLWTQANEDLWVNSIHFLPNGEQFVALNGGGVTGQVALWDTATGKEIRKLTDKGIKSISLSPDGKLLSAGHWNGRIEICDSTTAENKKLLDHDGMFIRVAFYGDGKKLVSGGSHESIKLWDLQDNQEPRIFQKELPKYEVAPSVEKIIVSPDAQRILAVHHFGGDTWDAKGGFVINSFKANRLRDGAAVVFSPDGARIAIWNYGDTIQLWDSQTGEEIPAVSGLGSSVRNVAFSPDGNSIAILDEDFSVKIWELESRKRKSDDELRRLAAPVPAWHRKQAESFESAGNLYAALFHRAWLWKLNPEDPKLLEEFRATFTSYQTQSAPDASLANRTLPTVVRELLAATPEESKSEESKQ